MKEPEYLWTVEDGCGALFKLNPASGKYEFEDGLMYPPGKGWLEESTRRKVRNLMTRLGAVNVKPDDPRIPD